MISHADAGVYVCVSVWVEGYCYCLIFEMLDMLDRRKKRTGIRLSALRIYLHFFIIHILFIFLFVCGFIRFVSVPQSRVRCNKATSWWLLFNQMVERYDMFLCNTQFANLVEIRTTI